MAACGGCANCARASEPLQGDPQDPPMPWPPPCTLPDAPFPSRPLAAVAAVAEALLSPGYWALDRLLALLVPTTAQRARWRRRRAGRCLAVGARVLAAPALVLALVLALPPALLGLLLWLPVQAKRRPFVHQRTGTTAEPWDPRRARGFTFLTANVCLLPSGLARFSNLGSTRQRAALIGRVLAAGAPAEHSGHRRGLLEPRRGYGGTAARGHPGGDAGGDAWRVAGPAATAGSAVEWMEMPMGGLAAMGNTTVMDNSTTMGNSTLIANSTLMDNSTVMDNSTTMANSTWMTNPTLMDNSTPMANSTLMANPTMMGNSTVMDNSTLMGNPTPMANPTPMTNSTWMTNPTLMDSPTPMGNPTLMDNSTPMANSTWMTNPAPMTNSTLMANPMLMDNSTTMARSTLMADPMLMTNPTPMANSTWMTNPTPMTDPTPMANSTPMANPTWMTTPTLMANPTPMTNSTWMTNSTPMANSTWMTNPNSMTNSTLMANPTPTANPWPTADPVPTPALPMTDPSLGAAPCPMSSPGPERPIPLADPMPPVLSARVPPDADFVCLQEVFDGAAAAALRRQLGRRFPHVLWGVGPGGLRCGRLRALGSGLLLGSRFPLLAARFRPFPNAAREDALANKGLLVAQVLLGTGRGRRVVGYLGCTHLQAPAADATIRDQQLSLVLRWLREFRRDQDRPGDLVAFDVLCGDLNFDNCSRGDSQNQRHALFKEFWDPACRDSGQEQPWAIGTLLNYLRIYDEPVSTPEEMRRTLSQPWGRERFLAGPILSCGALDPLAPRPWQGRRVDRALLRREPALTTEVTGYSVITELATLSDHLPVALRLRLGPADL